MQRLKRKLARPLAPPYAARFALPGVDFTSYDVIWVYELWTLAAVPRRHWSRVLWDKDTIMADSYADATSGGAWLMRRWIRWYERRALTAVKHAFLSLPSETAPPGPHISILPHGFLRSAPARTRPIPGPNSLLRLGFVGLFGHEPNRVGLTWFVSEVLPQLRSWRSSCGGVELHVAGGSLPAADATTMQSADGVVLYGYVENISDFYATVDLIVAPLLTGAGAPTKVAEALGHGVAVVGTSKGLRGLESELRAWCVEVNGTDWPQAIREGLKICARGVPVRNLCEQHSWSAVFGRVVDPLFEAAVDNAPAQAL